MSQEDALDLIKAEIRAAEDAQRLAEHTWQRAHPWNGKWDEVFHAFHSQRRQVHIWMH